MTTKDHTKLLGIFFLIHAGLQVFTGLIVTIIYGGMGGVFLANARRDEEQFMGIIFVVMSVVVGIIILAFAALFGMTGWKLFKNKPHSKVWVIIGSVLCLFGFPLGTALGVYGLWFALGDNGKEFYDGANVMNNYQTPPPPPNSWQ